MTNKTDPFYLSKRWQRLRKLVLVAARYTDQIRIRKGIHIEANTVHHIFPREQYPEYEWERWNMIAVNDQTHKGLHKPDGSLSAAGQFLLEETAAERGIPTSKMILIVGRPGSGKTTRAKQILQGGICYDLDAIAGALRLSDPHAERHTASRRMAQGMARYFAATARTYSGRVVMIRTAPTMEEVAEIDPDEVIICRHGQQGRKTPDLEEMDARIEDVKAWATASGIPIEDGPPGVTP